MSPSSLSPSSRPPTSLPLPSILRYPRTALMLAARLPHSLGRAMTLWTMNAGIRMNFLGLAVRSGVLSVLHDGPADRATIAGACQLRDSHLLQTVLDLGVGLGELGRDGDRYRLRGARARALAHPRNAPLAALVEEFLSYDTAVYQHLPAQLAGGGQRDFLAEHAPLVARASQVVEPLLGALVRDAVASVDPSSLLDVGCGSGVYLRHAVDASDHVMVTGIDLDERMIAAAAETVSTWDLDGRIRLATADVRDLPPDLSGPYDMVLLFQNIYYFAVDERTAVLASLRRLCPAGVVVVAGLVADGSPQAAHFDLELQATAGCARLPTARELAGHLANAGFDRVEPRRLAPGQPMRAFIAR